MGKQYKNCFFILCLISIGWQSYSQNTKVSTVENELYRMVERWYPGRSSDFVFKLNKNLGAQDCFKISSIQGKVKIEGNNGVSLASGWNVYLKDKCQVHISINGLTTSLPKSLPLVKEEITRKTPFRYRNFFNYCTFGYTMPWWDWSRWEKLIDWMAMNGVNMPLAMTGQEAVWRQLLKEQGLTNSEIKAFIVGPAFLPWGWMGNIDGMAGPIPDHWIDTHQALQRKILKRERTFGMTPILQGFTGHIPQALVKKNPSLKYIKTTDWAGMPGTHFLDPTDPLFLKLGKRFIEIQTQMYGTDHLYDADCFNEINPPSNDTKFISNVGKTVYRSMTLADPQAKWVMQGWFLFWQKKFWKEPQARALLDAIPNDRLLLLDLYGEKYPVWKETKAFYGKPWIWNIICNNGQKVNLSGDLQKMIDNLKDATTHKQAGKLSGIGVMMEGFGYNPVVQDLIGELTWNPNYQKASDFVRKFAQRRYGMSDGQVGKAWSQLLASVYSRSIVGENVLCYPPGYKHKVNASNYAVDYPVEPLFRACQTLLTLADKLAHNKIYQFDLVHTYRELLSLKADQYLAKAYESLKKKDLVVFEKSRDLTLGLLKDLDQLLGSHELFLLGKWVADAKKWGDNKQTQKYFASNAKSIVTLWQPDVNTHLRDYASRQWQGLVGDFYYHRWQRFFEEGIKAIQQNKVIDYKKLNKELIRWELNWVNQSQNYADKASGNPVDICKKLAKKYGEK